MSKTSDIQKRLTERIIAALESGDVGAWRKPWRDGFAVGVPSNAETGNAYRGGNTWALLFEQAEHGYSSPIWATYKQWQKLSEGRDGVPVTAKGVAPIVKGEKGTHLIRWVVRKPCKAHPADAHCDKCLGKPRMFPVGFVVFNADQTHAGRAIVDEMLADGKTEPIELRHDIDSFVESSGARVKYSMMGRAFYSSGGDYINMPDPDTFESSDGFYGTLLHELTHWTGHKSRCDRDQSGSFGSDSYAFEELVAELGSVFLCSGRFDIELPERDDHVAYLASWAKVLRAKPSILWTAATAASKAVEYLESLSVAPVPAGLVSA